MGNETTLSTKMFLWILIDILHVYAFIKIGEVSHILVEL